MGDDGNGGEEGGWPLSRIDGRGGRARAGWLIDVFLSAPPLLLAQKYTDQAAAVRSDYLAWKAKQA